MKPTVHRLAASALAACAFGLAAQARAEITLYEHENFSGRSFVVQNGVDNLRREGFNDMASSVIVGGPRWTRWEVCEDAEFGGRCVLLRSGRYGSLGELGLNDRISSLREISRAARPDRVEALPAGQRDFRRRAGEQLWVVDVLDVRAVVDTPQQRCWIEREQLPDRSQRNVPGAIAGAVLGGILGHQIGGGSGRDLATIGGVIGGAALGSQVGRNDNRTQDVQRCTTLSSETQPQFYDVTYEFRGQEHHVQMATPPGETLLVNANGEPRI